MLGRILLFTVCSSLSTVLWKQAAGEPTSCPALSEHSPQEGSSVCSASDRSTSDELEARFWKVAKNGDKIFQDPCGFTEECRISFALYGKNPKYVLGALRNLELQKMYFPGWVVRIYHDHSVPKEALEALEREGAELILVDSIKGSTAGMFWRFLVADDPTVDRFIVRDVDSRLGGRERAAVNEWIASGRYGHTIRDHPAHTDISINGGMWGARHGLIKDMEGMVRAWSQKDAFMEDINFLIDKIWPILETDVMQHDSYGCTKFTKNTRPFPTRRSRNHEHVGQVFAPDDKYRQGDVDKLVKWGEAPLECRGREDWTYA
uniref:Uncharacterized protein n=1 Tax=Chromera velia CCMP2878 TaxID=1169474 RepID=A0A0G4GUK4_9ALVE|eukprot:Cvel_23436.t1-p1 / transcript=Cvel_23436.t1 / gene=Cvel_23436 / organism=Chromera_velia_CCMP2878 / gene_product=hypothetical protein / transcript_product=hypothetical protein / location=Cvel_scaffold2415:14611-15564(+) / protein_length=318 / sequence_SO=supercontig / SO=protein_coding / is_pseudo=false